jgi:O-antigen ligase
LSWPAIRNLDATQIGAFLTLLIVVFAPNYGIERFGPSSVVPAALLALLGAWWVWRERAALYATPAQRRWVVLFLLLFVPMLVALPGSLKIHGSIDIAAVTAIYYLVGAALIHALRGSAERDWLNRWITVVVLFWVGDAILQYFLGVDLFGVRIDEVEGRVLGPFAANLRLSLFAVLLLPILLDRVFAIGTWLVLGLFVVVGAIAMLSGSRSILFYLVVVAGALLTRLPGGGRKWAAVVALAVVGIATVALSPVLQQRFGLFGELRAPSFATVNHLLSYRMNIWDTAYHMLEDRPLTGVGPGAFQAAYRHYSQQPGDIFASGEARAFHAHQLYIGLAAETGLIGLLAFGAMLWLGLRWYWTASPARRARAWPYALGLAVYVFPINSQPVLYLQWLFPVLLMLLAAMLAALDEPEPAGDAPAKPV